MIDLADEIVFHKQVYTDLSRPFMLDLLRKMFPTRNGISQV